jgi:hypothetical protein
MMGPRARLGTCLAIATISAAAASSAACSKAPAEKRALDRRTETARVQRNTELLQRQLELAAGKEFYLQRYVVLGLQVGHPRTAWFGERNPRTLQGVVWTHGELDPPRQIDRLVIQAGEPGKEAVDAATPPIPPTPEEMYPVPSRYRVRFGEGLSVEIRPREADATAGRWTSLRAAWSAKWRDALAAVRTRDRDAVRLRVVLNPKDAESLYRSLPPDLKLIVLAGGGEAAPSPEPPRGSAQDPAK